MVKIIKSVVPSFLFLSLSLPDDELFIPLIFEVRPLSILTYVHEYVHVSHISLIVLGGAWTMYGICAITIEANPDNVKRTIARV